MHGTLRTLLVAAESPDLLAEHDHETHVRFSRFCRRCVAELNLVQVGRARVRMVIERACATGWGELANGAPPKNCLLCCAVDGFVCRCSCATCCEARYRRAFGLDPGVSSPPSSDPGAAIAEVAAAIKET